MPALIEWIRRVGVSLAEDSYHHPINKQCHRYLENRIDTHWHHDEHQVHTDLHRELRIHRNNGVGCCVTQSIGTDMLTSRVHDAWCLDVSYRHRGQVIMMKTFVVLRQTGCLASLKRNMYVLVCERMYMQINIMYQSINNQKYNYHGNCFSLL